MTILTQNVCFREIIADQSRNFFNVKDEYKNLNKKELLKVQKRDNFPIQALFFNLTGDLNISSMIRSSCLHGVEKVWVFGRRKYDRRGLVGANNYIDIEQVNGFVGETTEFNVCLLKEIIEDNKFVPIYAEMNGIKLGTFSWKTIFEKIYVKNYKPLIIMGNESYGFPSYVIDALKSIEGSFEITIPQRGVMRSFNVSNAYAMILWDIRKDMCWF